MRSRNPLRRQTRPNKASVGPDAGAGHGKTPTVLRARSRLWQQGQRQEAYNLLAEIDGWFTEGFDTADLKEAKVLLDELEDYNRRARHAVLHIAQCRHTIQPQPLCSLGFFHHSPRRLCYDGVAHGHGG